MVISLSSFGSPEPPLRRIFERKRSAFERRSSIFPLVKEAGEEEEDRGEVEQVCSKCEDELAHRGRCAREQGEAPDEESEELERRNLRGRAARGVRVRVRVRVKEKTPGCGNATGRRGAYV